MKKKIYIANTSGLGNRLESLVLASMIEDYFGHQIYLDWPEADCLRIADTHVGAIPFWERPWSEKIRDFDAAKLETLGEVRIINLRGTYGPRELQRRYVLPTAARLRPHPRIGRAIRDTLASRHGRPAVAVHIRQGDFVVAGDSYDATSTRHPAPPLWWFEHVMEAWVRQFPDVFFALGYIGDPAALAQLERRFDIVTFPQVFDYRPLLPGHVSAGHPVVDMFGLACCTTLIASPTSNFSHWAGNLLGPRSRVVLPPPRMQRDAATFGTADLRGCVMLDWRDAAESGRGVTIIGADRDIPPPSPAVTDWL